MPQRSDIGQTRRVHLSSTRGLLPAVVALALTVLVACGSGGTAAGDPPSAAATLAQPVSSAALPESAVSSGAVPSSAVAIGATPSSAASKAPAAATPTASASQSTSTVSTSVVGRPVVKTTRTISFGGLTRQYVTVTPASGGRGLPLVVFLSGIDISINLEIQRDNLTSFVQAGQVDLVYPVAYQGRWYVGPGCCSKPGGAKPNDVAFARRVTALAKQNLRSDVRQTYLAGYSGGGKLAWKIACGPPTPFAAVATYGSAPVLPCPAKGSPLPVYIGFGDKDAFEPIGGSPPNSRGPHPPAAQNVSVWRTRDGCAANRHRAVVANQIDLVGWSKCSAAGLTVVYARWREGTHAMPAPNNVGLAASFGPNAWKFLRAHHK